MNAIKSKSGFLIGAAIGSGNTGQAAERGGADFLLAINAGRLRNMGAPSIACMLPIFDAQTLTEEFAQEELLALCNIPVLLGLNVWEQEFEPVAQARTIRDAGFAGAVNFPSCMHYSRPMQQILSRSGRGIEQEVEQLRAVQDAGLTSMFYCATRTQARLAADAGIDLICLNLGWNVGGALGHRSLTTIEEVATTAREIGRLIKRINPKTKFLLEGGPIGTPEDLGRVLNLAPIDGYVGGSTIDRVPLEVSVAGLIDGFRQASTRSEQIDEEGARLLSWAVRFGFVGRSKVHLTFLRRLLAMAAATAPVLLLAESGINPTPAINALTNPKRQSRSRNIVSVEGGSENSPIRIKNILFGHNDPMNKRQPLLSDSTIALLVIHAPERLTPATQRRLARALRDGTFRPPGARRSIAVVPRVIFVCNAPVSQSRLEGDLNAAGLEKALVTYLAGWVLRMPPLRERTDDLLAIVETQAKENLGVAVDRSSFSALAVQKLQAHTWPGNEVELHSVVGGLAGRSSSEPISPQELDSLLQTKLQGNQEAQLHTEKDRVVDALWRHGFNRTRTAEALGISRKTLYNKINKFELSG